ncbi:MAG: glycosyltransferase [Candidatus Omnitrophica bacterium]|nr:glycosyltransferase [Candidatus Omnitrophota bacterium]
MDNKRTLIVIPTYNERENVERLVTEILNLRLEADLLLIDDNSPDGTGEIIDRLAQSNPNITTIHRPGKLGVGSGHVDGILWGYAHGYGRLITMDCDFSHSPSYLPQFIQEGKTFDIVVGSRHISQKSLEGWDLFRKFLTKSAYFVTHEIVGIRFDATSGYRFYRLDRIPRAFFTLPHSKGYAFFFETIYLLQTLGFSIKEIPVNLAARTRGHSKMSVSEMGRSVFRLFRMALIVSLRRKKRLIH